MDAVLTAPLMQLQVEVCTCTVCLCCTAFVWYEPTHALSYLSAHGFALGFICMGCVCACACLRVVTHTLTVWVVCNSGWETPQTRICYFRDWLEPILQPLALHDTSLCTSSRWLWWPLSSQSALSVQGRDLENEHINVKLCWITLKQLFSKLNTSHLKTESAILLSLMVFIPGEVGCAGFLTLREGGECVPAAAASRERISVYLCIVFTTCPMQVVRQRELSFMRGQHRPVHIRFHVTSQQKAMWNCF